MCVRFILAGAGNTNRRAARIAWWRVVYSLARGTHRMLPSKDVYWFIRWRGEHTKGPKGRTCAVRFISLAGNTDADHQSGGLSASLSFAGAGTRCDEFVVFFRRWRGEHQGTR
ncbi:hypothetical protein KCP71_11750 [Salmonella enterica subsp. enterica]|nr:hypothetical protein KCP71_11750 [Salmonella enterica subsp. enterica]